MVSSRYNSDEENQGYDFQAGLAQPLPSIVCVTATERRRKRLVLLIPMIVIANISMLFITMYYNNCPQEVPKRKCLLHWLGRFSFEPWKENFMLGPSADTLNKMGGLTGDLMIHREGWRLISCIWLHAGVFHLMANMLSLLVIGIKLEQEFGLMRIGVVYLGAGLGGSLLSALLLPTNLISMGASGAMMGLLGAIVSMFLTNWTIYAKQCLALNILIAVILFNFASGLTPYVDNFTHIGGFASGFLLGFIFLMKPRFGWVNTSNFPDGYTDDDSRVKSKHTTTQTGLAIIATILLVVGYSIALVALFTGVEVRKMCHWCKYLDCVSIAHAWNCNYDSQ